jgi:hypothetical protein
MSVSAQAQGSIGGETLESERGQKDPRGPKLSDKAAGLAREVSAAFTACSFVGVARPHVAEFGVLQRKHGGLCSGTSVAPSASIMSIRIRVFPVMAALLMAFVLVTTASAEAQETAPSPSLRLQLGADRAGTPAYAEQLRLAEHSTAVPRVERIAGGVIMAGSGFVTLIGLLMTGLGRDSGRAEGVTALVGGLAGVGLGAGLLGHGTRRLRAIRQARRELSFHGAQLSVREGGGVRVGASFGF